MLFFNIKKIKTTYIDTFTDIDWCVHVVVVYEKTEIPAKTHLSEVFSQT